MFPTPAAFSTFTHKLVSFFPLDYNADYEIIYALNVHNLCHATSRSVYEFVIPPGVAPQEYNDITATNSMQLWYRRPATTTKSSIGYDIPWELEKKLYFFHQHTLELALIGRVESFHTKNRYYLGTMEIRVEYVDNQIIVPCVPRGVKEGNLPHTMEL